MYFSSRTWCCDPSVADRRLVPLGDWPFWVVTLAALVALGWLVRLVLPKKKRSVKTTLTVSAKKQG